MSTGATRTILIVDDEKLFRESLAQGLSSLGHDWRILLASNGREALSILASTPVDLVLTDIKMPELDGFGLLARMTSDFPTIPVIVMTAFGTAEINEKLVKFGVGDLVEKPVDFEAIATRLIETFDTVTSGVVRGISLATFLQLLELERKSCTIRVTSGERSGTLHLVQGSVDDAEVGPLRGVEAAQELIAWEHASIELGEPPARRTRNIRKPIRELLLDVFASQDERRAGRISREEEKSHPQPAEGPDEIETSEAGQTGSPQPTREVIMSAQEMLKELGGIEGFAGAGVYTPGGESLAVLSGGTGFTKEIGVHANNVLLNAQKASLEMGAGRGQMVHVEGEKANILVRCVNEGNDPLKSEPGKAHIHVVLALANDSAIGFAKMKLGSVSEKVAPFFRI